MKYTKAKLICLLDKYEEYLFSSTGRLKEEYIGEVGEIIHVQRLLTGSGSVTKLFDVRFADGATFCLDREQVELIG